MGQWLGFRDSPRGFGLRRFVRIAHIMKVSVVKAKAYVGYLLVMPCIFGYHKKCNMMPELVRSSWVSYVEGGIGAIGALWELPSRIFT